ncbi:peptidylprolyl isomerase [Vibrio sp. EJY3]|uniref:peptidylprolyl isomerase n=1 Tax=Vibrio sp. (strain EJY3) TaxID=1116375 RepID=UPI000243B364|nr:peptidylprolyl isomerase [Vibrio sp. EJY3]AEX24172.1 NifM protein a peptidyl-prolyl cis/trans isomerase [Vibrio sp. EJY3]
MEAYKRHYLTAKVATERYQLNPQWLSEQQKQDVNTQVEQLFRIQSAVLSSNLGIQTYVHDDELEQAINDVMEGYPSLEEFYRALNGQQLSESDLRLALKDELRCNKVLEKVSSDVPELSEQAAFEHYQANQEKFVRPSLWELSQILVTVNNDIEENHRKPAFARIQTAKQELKERDFSQVALKYSECPSAVNDGYLGWCEEAKLFPQIAQQLPLLDLMEISSVIETEIGFHLVRVHSVKPSGQLPFEQAYPYLKQKHQQRAKAYIQKQWVSQLLAEEG